MCTAVEGWGAGKIVGKVPLRVEPERLLDEGTEWVVCCSTETVDSSPSRPPELVLVHEGMFAT